MHSLAVCERSIFGCSPITTIHRMYGISGGRSLIKARNRSALGKVCSEGPYESIPEEIRDTCIIYMVYHPEGKFNPKPNLLKAIEGVL